MFNDAYPTARAFTVNELLDITPEDVRRWMSLMAYHKENPSKEDRPIYNTKNSLAYTKKALSYYMVHSDVQWNDITRFGNPTKSKAVNTFLRLINKLGTSDQGKASNADRAFEYEEVYAAINILSESGSSSAIERAMYACMFTYQCHMIARVDDVSKAKKQWLNFHPMYPHCLMGRLAWSKNVTDKRDSPWQIIVGGDTWQLDVMLRFAIFLELACESNFYRDEKQQYAFCVHQGDTPDRVKRRALTALKKKVINNPLFQKIFETTG